MMYDIPPDIHTVICNNCVYITNSEEVNPLNNPVYNVKVIVDYKVYDFYSLSGRKDTQDLDRNISGIEAPSPNGTYTIGTLTEGYTYETGGVFLPYEPNFETERSNLGWHWDPSWGLDNGEDGTEGCHAFESEEIFNNFYSLIKDNNINNLIIEYNVI